MKFKFSCLKRRIGSIRDFVTMPEPDRRSVLRNLTDEQYDDIMRVCKCYPIIDVKCHVKSKSTRN